MTIYICMCLGPLLLEPKFISTVVFSHYAQFPYLSRSSVTMKGALALLFVFKIGSQNRTLYHCTISLVWNVLHSALFEFRAPLGFLVDQVEL